MIKSNRAAALRWLAGNVGQTLDTVQCDAAGNVKWIPGPRVLDAASKGRFVMKSDEPGQARASYITTDPGNRYFVVGDTLTIETMISMVSGPDGAAEVWQTTHYTVRRRSAEPFVSIADLDAQSDGRISIIAVR